MNHIFRSIWNEALGAWVAVSELVPSQGKPRTRSIHKRIEAPEAAALSGRIACRRTLSLAIGLVLGTINHAHAELAPDALPNGGQVSSGQASIQQQGAQLNVTQHSDKVILNWQSFNIGKDAQVEFQQPDSQAVALNRVSQSDPSQILGKLSANGQIFLLNPNGVIFGSGAQVDVGGLVASTASLADANFNSGNYQFERQGDGAIINQGQISSKAGGYVALIADSVRNSGSIRSESGSVLLAAGESVKLKLNDGHLVAWQIDPATVKTLIDNQQLIQAADGRVILTAEAADQLQGSVVNNAGVIEATSLHNQGGVIQISGDTVNNSGRLDASGQRGGYIELAATAQSASTTPTLQNTGLIKANASAGQGGQIQLTGASITVGENSLIEANGTTGGGEINIGGGQHGAKLSAYAPNPSSQTIRANANRVNINAGATVNASATEQGDGGKIVVWSEQSTNIAGTIRAEGGAQGGNGGRVTLSAGKGVGELKLDGAAIDVSSAAGHGGDVTLTGHHIGLFGNSQIKATGSSGGGQILVGGDWQGSGPMPHASTVVVDKTASIDASATGTGDGGKVVLWSDDYTGFFGSITAQGGPQGGAGGRLETSSHNILTVTGLVDTGAAAGTAGLWLLDPSDITITSSGTDAVDGTNAYNPSAASGTISGATITAALASGDVTITTAGGSGGSGNITISDAIAYSSSTARTLTLTASGAISGTGNIGSSGGALSVIFDMGGDGTYSGNFVGTGSLTKAGSGTLTLSGTTNSYTGGIVINAGTLKIGKISGFNKTGTLSLGAAGKLDLNGYSLTLNSGSSLSLSPTTNSGAIINSNTTSNSAAALIFGADNSSLTFAGTIVDLGKAISLTKNGTGTLTLTGSNSLRGTILVNAGTVKLGADNAIGSDFSQLAVKSAGTLDLNGFDWTVKSMLSTSFGAVTNSSSHLSTLNIGVDSTKVVFYLSINGNIAVDKKPGSGVATLALDSSYTGGTLIEGGTLQIGSYAGDGTLRGGTALGTEGDITFAGGTLGYTYANDFHSGGTDYSSRFKVTPGNSYLLSVPLGSDVRLGALQDTSVTLVKSGPGYLRLQQPSVTLGGLTVKGGTLYLQTGSNYTFPKGSTVEIDSGAKLDLQDATLVSVDRLTGAGTIVNALNHWATLEVNSGDATGYDFTGTYAAAGNHYVTNRIAFIKKGSDTLTLHSSNITANFESMEVDGGTLVLGDAGVLQNTPYLTVGAGATLDLNGVNESALNNLFTSTIRPI